MSNNRNSQRSVASCLIEALEPRILLSASMYVGTNLDGIADWDPVKFVDVASNSRVWQTRNIDGSGDWSTGLASYMSTDSNDWPLQIPFDPGTGDMLQYVHTIYPIYGTGTYKLHVEGTGTLRFSANNGYLDPTTNYFRSVTIPLTGGVQEFDLVLHDTQWNDGTGNLAIAIIESDPAGTGDYVRNIDLVLPGHDLTYQTEPFVASYTQDLAPFANLRFMDWGKTNRNPLVTWDERTTLDSYTQGRTEGASLEYMIQLANELNQDAWFCIPAQADDNYVQQAAQLIHSTLDPSLKAFVEYSNETWNSHFSQTTYVQDMGESLGLDANRWTAGQKYVSYRSAQIWSIFENEFGTDSADRLVKVMATQAGSTSITTTRLEALQDPAINPTGIQPDTLAIAPYFGGEVADQIVDEGLVGTITVPEILSRAQAQMQTDSTAWVANQKALADQYDLWLIAYEGGQHLVGTGANVDNQDLADLLIAANRDPGMYSLYIEYMDMLANGGVSLFSNFSYVVEASKFGSWGVKETQDQSLAEAHKYRALADWITANPVTNLAPKARAGADQAWIDYGNDGQDVSLQGADSRDFDGSVVSYEWLLNGQTVGTTANLDINLTFGYYDFTLRVTDDLGAVNTDTIHVTVLPEAAAEMLVDSDFTGTDPGLNLPWTQTSELNSNVTFSGWSLGSGFWGSSGDNALVFSGDLGYTGETTLAQALAGDYYLTTSLTPQDNGSLDLRGAEFSFTVDRLDWHSPRQYVVMSSLDGFDTESILFDTGRFTTTVPQTFSFSLPLDGYVTDQPVEFRIYAFAGQYIDRPSSLTDFSLHGDWVASVPTGMLVDSDFTGDDPGLNTPWTQTSVLNPGVTFSGWSFGSGFWGVSGDDALVFTGNMGSSGERTLAEALAQGQYITTTVAPVTGGMLDLCSAEFSFTIDRITWHSPRQYVVMSSLDGFDTESILFDTGRFTTTAPQTFSFSLPLDGYLTDQPVEFRIYAFAGQYLGHTTSLTDFSLFAGAPALLAAPAGAQSLATYETSASMPMLSPSAITTGSVASLLPADDTGDETAGGIGLIPFATSRPGGLLPGVARGTTISLGTDAVNLLDGGGNVGPASEDRPREDMFTTAAVFGAAALRSPFDPSLARATDALHVRLLRHLSTENTNELFG